MVMRRIGRIAAVTALVIAAAVISLAHAAKKDKNKDKTAAIQAPAGQQEMFSAVDKERDAEKTMLINNIQIMQNLEARVAVLQQLLNREVGDLRQMQAVFCDQYKLDIEKWRRGAYRYDDKQAKFVETN